MVRGDVDNRNFRPSIDSHRNIERKVKVHDSLKLENTFESGFFFVKNFTNLIPTKIVQIVTHLKNTCKS